MSAQPFVVYVAADLYNSKVNLELTFPSHPTMGELKQHIHAVFSAECAALIDDGRATASTSPPPKLQQFGISRVQIYSDDGSGEWLDLTTASAIQPYSQIYVFQSDPNYRESQDQIPAARRPACYSGYAPLWSAATTSSKPPTKTAKLEVDGARDIGAVRDGAGPLSERDEQTRRREGAALPTSSAASSSSHIAKEGWQGINNSRAILSHTPPQPSLPPPPQGGPTRPPSRVWEEARGDGSEAPYHVTRTTSLSSSAAATASFRKVGHNQYQQQQGDGELSEGRRGPIADGEDFRRIAPAQPQPRSHYSSDEDARRRQHHHHHIDPEVSSGVLGHDYRQSTQHTSSIPTNERRGGGGGGTPFHNHRDYDYEKGGAIRSYGNGRDEGRRLSSATAAASTTITERHHEVEKASVGGGGGGDHQRGGRGHTETASSHHQLFFAAASSHSDKVQLIFEASCRHGARHLQEGDFRALFRDTNMGFAPHVISALFRQADTDRDGVLTIAEMQHLLREYPTLTDALFFRLKDMQEGEALQQRLADACISLEEVKRRREQTVEADKASSSRVAEQLATMKKLEVQWQERLATENELTTKLAAERDATVAIQEAAAAYNKDMTVMVGRDDSARRFLVEAERETLYCQQQHKKALDIAKVADHRVKELMELLEAAKLEAAQQHRNAEEAEAEVKRAEAKEKRAAEQFSAFSAELQRRKAHSEQLSDDLLEHRRRAEELRRRLDECQSENERLAMTVERSAEELRRLEGGRNMCRRDVALAEAAIAEAEKRVAEADRAIEVFAQRRAATEAKERPLLEQEIRLKEQRLSLDENETMLRREAYNVFDPLARGSLPSTSSSSTLRGGAR